MTIMTNLDINRIGSIRRIQPGHLDISLTPSASVCTKRSEAELRAFFDAHPALRGYRLLSD